MQEACEAAQLATREAERVEQLVASGLVSRQRLDQAVSARDTAVAGCEAARARARQGDAALQLASVQQAKTVIRAPFDGIVAEVSAEVGEWITPAPPGVPIPPVIELIDPDQIYVSAPLDEVDSGKVRPGLPVRVTMDARPGAALAGRVARVAPYVHDTLEPGEYPFAVERPDLAQRLQRFRWLVSGEQYIDVDRRTPAVLAHRALHVLSVLVLNDLPFFISQILTLFRRTI